MRDKLILALDFKTPPSAGDLGEVFSALARDYREMTKGRTLVVIRVESGSIIATLTDAAFAAAPYVAGGLAVITAVNTLAEFAENLKKWLGYAKSKKEKGRLYRKGRKSPGQRSAEAIVKIAANTGSHVHVKYESAKGETLEAELTPAQAIRAREQQPEEEIKNARLRPMLPIPHSGPEVREAIDRLRKIDAHGLSPTEVHALVDVIVAALLAAGAGYLLPEIASELEMRGLHNIASAVRQHIRPSTGTHEPPLTTS